MTKAELKRRLVPGTQLTLVNSLLGPTRQHRTVKQARSADYIMTKPDGKDSYLPINSNEEVRETEKGFAIFIKAGSSSIFQGGRLVPQPEQLAAEYVWGHV